MLYLIIDPKTLLLPSPNEITRTELGEFYVFLRTWKSIADTYLVEFVITKNTLNTIKTISSWIFDEDIMRSTGEKLLPTLNMPDLLRVYVPLLQQLQQNHILDDILSQIYDDRTMDIDFYDVLISPVEFLTRLDHAPLTAAFGEMLRKIAFARQNHSKRLFKLENVLLLTKLNEQEWHEWGSVAGSMILIGVNYILAADDGGIWQAAQNTTSITDAIGFIQTSDQLHGFTPHRSDISFKTVDEAVSAAVDTYPQRLILHTKAEMSARNAGYQKPQKMYDAILGLVTHWLPAYEQANSEIKADKHYTQNVGYKISTEGQRVRQNPKLRKEREVLHNGQVHFVERHIKLGSGPNAARIHFAVVEENGYHKILIARAGAHAPTARRPT